MSSNASLVIHLQIIIINVWCMALIRSRQDIVSECYCMIVWVMGGVWQGCYMTICLGMESLVTLETLTGKARLEKSIAATPLPGKLLLCHTKMMDCHCF